MRRISTAATAHYWWGLIGRIEGLRGNTSAMTLRARPLSRASLLPQGLGGVGRFRIWRPLNVGVGLLTKGAVHSAMMLTEWTLSRASPLPLGVGGVGRFCIWRPLNVGVVVLGNSASGTHRMWEWACSRRGRRIQSRSLGISPFDAYPLPARHKYHAATVRYGLQARPISIICLRVGWMSRPFKRR